MATNNNQNTDIGSSGQPKGGRKNNEGVEFQELMKRVKGPQDSLPQGPRNNSFPQQPFPRSPEKVPVRWSGGNGGGGNNGESSSGRSFDRNERKPDYIVIILVVCILGLAIGLFLARSELGKKNKPEVTKLPPQIMLTPKEEAKPPVQQASPAPAVVVISPPQETNPQNIVRTIGTFDCSTDQKREEGFLDAEVNYLTTGSTVEISNGCAIIKTDSGVTKVDGEKYQLVVLDPEKPGWSFKCGDILGNSNVECQRFTKDHAGKTIWVIVRTSGRVRITG